MNKNETEIGQYFNLDDALCNETQLVVDNELAYAAVQEYSGATDEDMAHLDGSVEGKSLYRVVERDGFFWAQHRGQEVRCEDPRTATHGIALTYGQFQQIDDEEVTDE